MLIIGSGNIVHNLPAVDFAQPNTSFDWAQRFDQKAREVLESDPIDVAALDAHPDFAKAVPTPDHYLPMVYIAGLANDQPLDLLVDGHTAGSISMAAYTLGLDQPVCGVASDSSGPASALPDIPMTESNV